MTAGQAFYLRRRIGGLQLGTTLRARRAQDRGRVAPSSAASPTATWYAARRRARHQPARADRLGGHARSRSARPPTPRSCSPCASPRRARSSSCSRAGSRRSLSFQPRGRPGAHPELLDHRPHRPRQVDAGRSHPRAHAHRRPARDARPAARLDGPRARARDHDQGPGRARLLHRARRRALPVPPDRHARPRRLHLRSKSQPRRVRGGAAGGRRVARASRPRPSPTPTWRSTPGSS